MIAGKVLDVPALVDLATGRTEYMRALAYIAATRGDTLAVPAAALSQAAVSIGDGARDELIWAIESASVVVLPLDEPTAFDAAARARLHWGGDVVAGQVASVATERGWPVVTSPSGVARWRAAGIEAEPLP